ncbi:hypothetical protein [Streptomyces yerevanensis]|uniref:hypothetical protein n=1 Tax=Streptomyces yerevanensis TaxID=66378 RepID=UPI0012FF2EE6|nr:hypothetical protein [Streptomyces yerevanensis]
MSEQNSVEAELADLRAVGPDEMLTMDAPIVTASMRRLLRRIDDPASSMGGYNPQRDE